MLQEEQKQQLLEWVGIAKQWKIILQTDPDLNVYTGKAFHNACDGKGENLGVIRSKQGGYLFGWWTPKSWQSRGKEPNDNAFISDTSTFIFTLTNPAGVPAKYMIKKHQYALYDHVNKGPTLGFSDIEVSGDVSSDLSYTDFPNSYEDTTGRGEETFTGHLNFIVDDMEVFIPV